MTKLSQNLQKKGTIALKLLDWFEPEKRALPWKKSKNAYLIWLSEVILQQTRVAQGTPYYLKFEAAFPTVQDLASAPIEQVLKLWEGLGYYSRARNLHAAARYIVDELDGQFPKDYKTLLHLKGVGEYTAAAIASFAYDEAVAVVDGNVYRFLSRIFGIQTPIDSTEGKKEFKKVAQQALNKNRAADYNQAIMDFGALVCTPKNPQCSDCPFLNECIAFKEDKIDLLPIKSKKIKKRNRYFNYFIAANNTSIFIKQRNEKDIWNGLFEFPMIETEQQLLPFEALESHFRTIYPYKNKIVFKPSLFPTYKQTLTHQYIYAQFILCSIESIEKLEMDKTWISIKKAELIKYPFPKIINSFLSEFKF